MLRSRISNVLKPVVTDIHYLKHYVTMNEEKCKFCNDTALVYNSYICDSKCEECGEWQEGESYE